MERPNDIFEHLKKGNIDTPDAAYFEQLAQKVIASQAPKIIPLYKRPVIWLAASAAAVAVIVLFTLGGETQNDNPLLALNDFSAEEVFNYVDEHIEAFDTDMLIEAVPSESIETVALDLVTDKLEPSEQVDSELNFDNIDDSDIREYLNNESLDLDDLDDDFFI